MAEIAGVFVGFGTLIAVRRERPTDWHELVPLRSMLGLGMLTVVAALAPLTVGGFELSEHQVWAVSSAVVLIGWVLLIFANSLTPEYRTYWKSAATPHPRWSDAIQTGITIVYMLAVLVALVVIVLGLAPGLESALYAAIVVLMVVGAGWSLLTLVFARRPSQEDGGRDATA